MSNACLINILAHGGAQSVFDRHMPLWKKHGYPIKVWCPTNDRVASSEPVVAIGYSVYKRGEGHVLRIKALMHDFILSSYQFTMICEYDSFSLRDRINLEPGLTGIMFKDMESFIAPKYVMSPWILDKESAVAMFGKWVKYPNIKEMGCIDRLLPALAYVSGVPIISHSPLGFSHNLIHLGNINELTEAILNGGHEFHGVKDSEILAYITELHAKVAPTIAQQHVWTS